MERPTIELLLPISGARVVLYQYMTTGQFRDLQKALVKDVQFDLSKLDPNEKDQEKTAKSVEIKSISPVIGYEQEEMVLKFLVKEIIAKEGNTITDITAFVYDLPRSDGDLLYKKINELENKSSLSEEAKKK